MNEASLRSLFRHVVLATIAAPVVACGGQVDTVPTDAASDTSTSTDTLRSDTSTSDTISPVDVGGDALCTPISRGGGACDDIVDFPCGIPDGLDAGLTTEQCKAMCPETSPPGGIFSCWFEVRDGGPLASLHCTSCAVGRRPEGFVDATPECGSETGDWFARVAALEAASIDAFKTLRAELRAHGAPRRLRDSALRAERDEVRHARTMAAIARRFGGAPTKPRIVQKGIRSLEAIAIENAVEGCVRETFGALVATVQAERARDRRVRSAMKKIANDETRHAALSWSLARWLDSKLDAKARKRVAAARARAVASLRAELHVEPSDSLREHTGMPRANEAVRMADRMAERLWC